jgi:ubiquinone biosynthesis protein
MSQSASPQSERPSSRTNRTRNKRRERITQAAIEGVTAWQSRPFALADGRSAAPERFRPVAFKDGRINGRFAVEGDLFYDAQMEPLGDGRHNGVPLDPNQPGVMSRLPRRRLVNAAAKDVEAAPPQMRFVSFQTTYGKALVRLFRWAALLLTFAAGILGDKLRRQDSPERRAVRLRQLIEQRGDTFVKIGQYLAMRIDFIPWSYCAELSRMRDKTPPFPTTEAIAKVEQATGRPLAETFAQFDPEPVGSTILTCVYQAVLKETGQKVVVKVRRPGVGERFMADFLALDVLALAAEFMTFFRPGHTKEMRREFRQTLLEELDFIQEARYQDSFRRAAKKSSKPFFTSPRVHFDLCSADVIVEEFVNGLWLWELLAAVERDDPDILALAASLDIDPHVVARRLSWVNFWGWHEHLFFHADPHPDNIIVGRITN